MFWSTIYPLESISSLPAGRFAYCFCFSGEQFFALVNARGVKTYWLGTLNGSAVGEKLRRNFVVKLRLQHHKGFTIKVATRALYFGVTDSLRREVTTVLTKNPCLKHLFSSGMKLSVAVKPITDFKEGKEEIKKFLSITDGFCFPASCGCDLCEEIGGVSVPTFIGGKEIC